MIERFHKTSQQCSKIITENYSTSFALAIKFLHKDIRPDIHSIYGFVRFADEIVDTFHAYNKELLLEQFRNETYKAINEKISLNPILHSFQLTINKYHIDLSLIEAFFKSMQYDLHKNYHNEASYKEYIYGSAESVGLICLHIFCAEDKLMFKQLEEYAKRLGAAFQKVNFLRDIRSDKDYLNRVYFPDCNFKNFTSEEKKLIEADIQQDFEYAYTGILKLPPRARFGVYLAYKYYFSLFSKIKKLQPSRILEERIRIPNYGKAMIIMRAGVKSKLHLI